MLHATQVATWSQHVGEGEERHPMLDVAPNLVRNMLGTCSQHAQKSEKALRNIAKVVRNICYASQRDRRLIGFLHPNRAAQDPSDASTQIGRPALAAPFQELYFRFT
jgi:hypothetical protein